MLLALLLSIGVILMISIFGWKKERMKKSILLGLGLGGQIYFMVMAITSVLQLDVLRFFGWIILIILLSKGLSKIKE